MLRPSEPPHPGLGTVLIATAGKGVRPACVGEGQGAAATARALTPCTVPRLRARPGTLPCQARRRMFVLV